MYMRLGYIMQGDWTVIRTVVLKCRKRRNSEIPASTESFYYGSVAQW